MGNNPSFKGLRGNWPFGGDYPLQCVNWWEVFAFCNALSKAHGLAACYELEGWTDGLGCPGTLPGQASLPGQAKCTEDAEFAWPMECSGVKFAGLDCPGYRLPTEAEWEYSARAGTTTATYNGTVQYPDGAFDCDIAGPVLDPIAWWVCNYKGTQHPVAQKLPNAWGAYDMIGNVDEMVWDFLGDYEGYPPEPATDPLGPEAGSHRIIRGGSAPSPVEWCRSAWRFAGLERARLGGFRVVRTAKSPGAATP
jgi:formylglycine-generating enzyme required for sulfatase activity